MVSLVFGAVHFGKRRTRRTRRQRIRTSNSTAGSRARTDARGSGSQSGISPACGKHTTAWSPRKRAGPPWRPPANPRRRRRAPAARRPRAGARPSAPSTTHARPAVVAKAQLRTPWRRIVPPEQTPAQPTTARVRIVPPAETPAQPTATPKPHSFLSTRRGRPTSRRRTTSSHGNQSGSRRSSRGTSVDGGRAAPSTAATCAFNVVSCIAVRTGDSVVEASASRTMAQFHRLRRDLLALMQRLSMSVMRVEALGGGRAPPALHCPRRVCGGSPCAPRPRGTSRRCPATARRGVWRRRGPSLPNGSATSWPSCATALGAGRRSRSHASRSRVGQGAAAAAEAEARCSSIFCCATRGCRCGGAAASSSSTTATSTSCASRSWSKLNHSDN